MASGEWRVASGGVRVSVLECGGAPPLLGLWRGYGCKSGSALPHSIGAKNGGAPPVTLGDVTERAIRLQERRSLGTKVRVKKPTTRPERSRLLRSRASCPAAGAFRVGRDGHRDRLAGRCSRPVR